MIILGGCHCGITPIDVETFFGEYNLEQYTVRMAREDIHFLGYTEDYALMYYSGDGPELMLYRYTSDNSNIRVTGYAHGQYTISGGVSINHIETDNCHIYFGTVSNYHWVPAEDTKKEFNWGWLNIQDSSGDIHQIDMSNSKGFLCVLDSPMLDFYATDKQEYRILDMETYFAQGYSVAECEFQEK